MTAAGGAAEDGPGAPLATPHGPAAEVLYGGAECDVDMGHAAEAPAATAAAAVGVQPPRPRNLEPMSKNQKKSERNIEGGHVECKVVAGPNAAWRPTLL